MRYDKNIKTRVRLMRRKGSSLNEIHFETNIPKTTIRSWIKDIKLSDEQVNKFKQNIQVKLQEGRAKAQARQKETRNQLADDLRKKGINDLKILGKKELLVAGVALYWAEGFKNKHEHRLGFCNSDPRMIQFYIKWLKAVFKVEDENIIVRVSINESHRARSEEIIRYWSTITNLPTSQFTQTFYQKSKWKKQFNDDNYFGVLRVHVKKSID